MRDPIDEVLHTVHRRDFLAQHEQDVADLDTALPIAGGQTNSQPSTVAAMLRLLEVRPGDRVLDVGAGSGWSTALLSRLVGPDGVVLGVERVAELIEPARRAVRPYAVGRTEIRLARSGVLGAPEQAPFQRILVSAEADEVPRQLLDQLADGGVLVLPVAGRMLRVRRRGRRFKRSRHGWYRFVPLIRDP